MYVDVVGQFVGHMEIMCAYEAAMMVILVSFHALRCRTLRKQRQLMRGLRRMAR